MNLVTQDTAGSYNRALHEIQTLMNNYTLSIENTIKGLIERLQNTDSLTNEMIEIIVRIYKYLYIIRKMSDGLRYNPS